MKIFITGGSGLLGQYLNLELSRRHEILTQFQSNIGNCVSFNHRKFRITDFADLEEVLSTFNPDVVIHAAAVSNPEKADSLPANLVYDINVNVTAKIAELCRRFNSKLVYMSTDLVYAGSCGSMLGEDAKLIPISLYAETKLMGERKIQETFDNYIILREALLIGFGLNHSRNNFHLMYEKLLKGETVQLFTDQFRTPLALHEAAEKISNLIEMELKGEIINFAGSERISRYELGVILCEEAGLDKNLLVGRTMEEAGLIYKVADVSMNTEKLQSFGLKTNNCRDSVKEILLRGKT